jgi:hypothetical protein
VENFDRQLVGKVPAARAPLWTLGNHNGTSWATSEWGRALQRIPRAVASAPQWYPAVIERWAAKECGKLTRAGRVAMGAHVNEYHSSRVARVAARVLAG